jgi:hypothetical protein
MRSKFRDNTVTDVYDLNPVQKMEESDYLKNLTVKEIVMYLRVLDFVEYKYDFEILSTDKKYCNFVITELHTKKYTKNITVKTI